jgi:hypothetical protein
MAAAAELLSALSSCHATAAGRKGGLVVRFAPAGCCDHVIGECCMGSDFAFLHGGTGVVMHTVIRETQDLSVYFCCRGKVPRSRQAPVRSIRFTAFEATAELPLRSCCC